MTTQTIKIKNGAIAIPSEFKQYWQNIDVRLQISKDSIYVKRLNKPTLSEMLDGFRKVGKNISKKDVSKAIKNARREICQ